ncbi:ATP synthase F1 subunit gamma [Mycoplasma sp. P36-A1]|uniref:ATP synthase F1 subunit gamma n=1 Tax=Mycoplasma sp. P36-A1 TaxID=3252900 RepID=UPI003C2EC63A
MANLQNTKRRIKSVDSTKKITKAMELVASAKLRKAKKEYTQSESVRKFVTDNMSAVIYEVAKQNGKKEYIESKNDKTLYVVIGGNMGLTGGYNINVSKEAFLDSKPGDAFLCYGRKPVSYLKSKDAQIIYLEDVLREMLHNDKEVFVVDEIHKFSEVYVLTKPILHLFNTGQYGKVKLVYTKFVNSVTFSPKVTQLIPVENTFTELLAPFDVLGDSDNLIDDLLKDYLATNTYTAILEGKACEYASSRLAMETATDNAEELKEQLQLEYNRVRQANITQELTEIVGGANAI